MIDRLLENLLEDVTASLSMWLTPNGEEEPINEINHMADATVRLAKLRGEKVNPSDTYNYITTKKNFYEFMKISGYIRLYLSSFGDELDVSVGGKVTPTQLVKIGKMAREYSTFYWDIHQGTLREEDGTGFREFVNVLRSYKLLEKIDEQLLYGFRGGGPEIVGDWGFIDLSGGIIQLEHLGHRNYAKNKLKKLHLEIPKSSDEIIAKFLSVFGYIRFYVQLGRQGEGTEAGFSIVGSVNSAQTRTIKKLSSGDAYVVFDILDEKGGILQVGTGLPKLISTLKNMNLLEARGHWRNWSEVSCTKCPWRDYQKNFAKRGEKIPKVCPECGSELKLVEAVEDYGTKVSGSWLKPNGSFESLTFMHHAEDAVKQMKIITGKRYTNSHKAWLDLMKLKGYIAVDEDYPNQSDISIGGKVTTTQLSVIKKIARDNDNFYYSIYIKPGKVEHGDQYYELVGILRTNELIESLKESRIDFPREDLDFAVWDKKGDIYTLKEEVKEKIFDFLKGYEEVDLLNTAKEIHIVGSITSNQYSDDADIDVHILPKSAKEWNADSIKELQIWFNDHRGDFDGYVNEHPIEVYIQINESQDLLSVGCYGILSDRWLVGPVVVPSDYDPYEDFSGVASAVKDVVKDADVLFGEIKRDVIDYEVINSALKNMSKEDQEKLRQRLQSKLTEIEDSIELLYKERKGYADVRKTMSSEQALKDVDNMEQWKDADATFKFINRYRYFKIIGDLNDLLADEKVTPDEIDNIKSIMGV